MSKILTKRLYDVIAELQAPSSSTSDVPESETIGSRLAVTLMDSSPNIKRMRTALHPQQSFSAATVNSNKEQPKISDSQHTTETTRPSQQDQDASDKYASHLNHVQESILNLHQVYLYGLQTVSELQDLQDAPDAILPGNFVSEEEYE